MLSETIITILFRGLPEAFIHIFAMYAFSGIKVDKQKYVLSSMLVALMMVIVRALPISYGIHTILIIMGIIGICVGINKFTPIFVIKVCIINVVIQFLAEGINILLIDKVFGLNMDEIFADPINKIIYGIPSILIWAGIIVIAYKVKRIKMKVQNV